MCPSCILALVPEKFKSGVGHNTTTRNSNQAILMNLEFREYVA